MSNCTFNNRIRFAPQTAAHYIYQAYKRDCEDRKFGRKTLADAGDDKYMEKKDNPPRKEEI